MIFGESDVAFLQGEHFWEASIAYWAASIATSDANFALLIGSPPFLCEVSVAYWASSAYVRPAPLVASGRVPECSGPGRRQ